MFQEKYTTGHNWFRKYIYFQLSYSSRHCGWILSSFCPCLEVLHRAGGLLVGLRFLIILANLEVTQLIALLV
uniref:Uncharacterized protein n=1 Tax=Anguilla anguilla TaxID=7936 RepID=A0A0E9XS87_ANGAN